MVDSGRWRYRAREVRMSFFDRLEPAAQARVRSVALIRELQPGEYLLREGDRGRALFELAEGRLEARRGDEFLERCEPGDVLGEIAYFDGGPRSADVVAVEPSRVLVWPHDRLDRLIAENVAIRVALLEEVVERQSRALRRLTLSAQPVVVTDTVPLEAGTFRADERIIERFDGEKIKLSPTEARLLSYLASRPSRELTYETLLNEVWGYSRGVSSRTIYVTMHRLRNKVELDSKQPRHIHSVTGVGYRFEP